MTLLLPVICFLLKCSAKSSLLRLASLECIYFGLVLTRDEAVKILTHFTNCLSLGNVEHSSRKRSFMRMRSPRCCMLYAVLFQNQYNRSENSLPFALSGPCHASKPGATLRALDCIGRCHSVSDTLGRQSTIDRRKRHISVTPQVVLLFK